MPWQGFRRSFFCGCSPAKMMSGSRVPASTTGGSKMGYDMEVCCTAGVFRGVEAFRRGVGSVVKHPHSVLSSSDGFHSDNCDWRRGLMCCATRLWMLGSVETESRLQSQATSSSSARITSWYAIASALDTWCWGREEDRAISWSENESRSSWRSSTSVGSDIWVDG